MQIGTNNCTARYRTLSGGGIGESPSLSPSPSSDYDDDEAATKQPHLPTLNCNSKNKRNGNHKGAIISQKATVHHVSTLTQKSFAQHNNFSESSFSSQLALFPSLSRSSCFCFICLLSSRAFVVVGGRWDEFGMSRASNEIAHFDSRSHFRCSRPGARSRDGRITRETIVKRKSNYLFGFVLRADERIVHGQKNVPFELGIRSWRWRW